MNTLDARIEFRKGTTGAAILAGGLSSRMGVNKALLRTPLGTTVIEEVVSALREAGLEPDLVVTNTPSEFDTLSIPTAPDTVQGAGPLAGILTALLSMPYERVFIVPCDMPLLSPALLRFMASLPFGSDAIVPRLLNADGSLSRTEHLHAIYSHSCIGPIQQRIARTELKASDLLGDLNVLYLDESVLRRYDPSLRSFLNANTPADWEAIKGAWAK